MKAYTPTEVAEMLQISKNTVYELIKRGEILAKRVGTVYRIPPRALSFIFTGLDDDIYEAEQKDKKNTSKITSALKQVRSQAYAKK